MSKFNFDAKTRQSLKRIFKSGDKAVSKLEETIDDFIKSTLKFDLIETFVQNFINSLKLSPDPEKSLINFHRFTEATFNKASLYNDLALFPQMTKILLITFGYSQYFADILVRDPELFRWLTYTNALDIKLSKEDYIKEAQSTIYRFQSVNKKLNALRRFKRREILRIGIRDIFGIADFEETVLSLSELASSIVDICLKLAVEVTKEKFSSFPETEFAIIGLGKLGGEELNYSSDIDLIFVYNQEGKIQTTDGDISYYEIFNYLVSTLINFLSEKTEEGSLYRVDFRLRPEGSVGSLARSLLGYLTYYEVYGKIWERQMLIKARPIAGDINFGWEFIQMLDSFIYPKSFLENPIDEIAKIKSKIEVTSTSELNIKLRKGGIRDIEFIVQTLQLLNAGKNAELKERNTLRAIEKLAKSGLLTNSEAKILTENYIYFRRIEHLLQISQDTQTHTIPPDPWTLTSLAKAMKNYERRKEKLSYPDPSLPDWKIFKRELEKKFDEVREIYDKIFKIKTKPIAFVPEIVEEEVGKEKLKKFLIDLNFKDIDKAIRNIEFLSKGKLITGEEIFSAIEENSFQKISPSLFTEISKTIIPDITLENFRKIAEGFRYSKSFYELLQNDDVRRILLNISQFSQRFSNLLSLKTYLLEVLLSEDNLSKDKKTEEVFEFFNRAGKFKIHDFKFLNELRLLILNLDGFIDFFTLSRELTKQADLILNKTFFDIFTSEEAEKIAIIGLGKFGSSEMNFDSDIDMVMLTDVKDPNEERKLLSKCETFIKKLTELELEKLYNVDIRLRPEGRNAPMLVEVDYLKSYFKNRAELWEVQAFTRARFCLGSEKIFNIVSEILNEGIKKITPTKSFADYVLKMREKMEKNVKHSKIDIKLSPGALTDIEFIAQISQMIKFKHFEKIEKNTAKALSLLFENDLLKEDEYQTLISNYEFYREVEKFLRVSLWTKSNTIPDDSEKLEYLSLCLGYKFSDEFVDSVKSRMSRTREIFHRIIERLTRR